MARRGADGVSPEHSEAHSKENNELMRVLVASSVIVATAVVFVGLIYFRFILVPISMAGKSQPPGG